MVWSESDRDFLPSTFTAQYNFVCIVVYPHRRSLHALPAAATSTSSPPFVAGGENGEGDEEEKNPHAAAALGSGTPQRLYHIQVIAKEPLGKLVTTTGPLADGAVVGADALPMLLRLTCLNISSALRAEMEGEVDPVERRACALERSTAAAHFR